MVYFKLILKKNIYLNILNIIKLNILFILSFPPHCFEIQTTLDITYCVGENLESLPYGNTLSTKLPKQTNSHGVISWQAWFQVIVFLFLFNQNLIIIK